MSMFHAAMSPSLIGLPKRGLSASGCTGCAPVVPRGIPVADFACMPPAPPRFAQERRKTEPAITPLIAKPGLRLADDIAYLPVGRHRPWLNRVVVLNEAYDGALLLDVLHSRLDVTVAVHRAAHQRRRLAVKVPADLEAGEAFVHDRLFELGFAPVLAAVERDIDRADLAGARPGEAGHFVEARPLEVHAARGVGDDRLGLHHHAELAPLAFVNRIPIARGLAAEMPRLLADFDAAQPLHADVAFPPGKERAHRITVLRTQRLAVHGVHDHRVVEHFL